MVLFNLSDQAPGVLAKMPEQTLASLIEMARWKDGHSLMALQLVGSIAGASKPVLVNCHAESRGAIASPIDPPGRQT